MLMKYEEIRNKPMLPVKPEFLFREYLSRMKRVSCTYKPSIHDFF